MKCAEEKGSTNTRISEAKDANDGITYTQRGKKASIFSENNTVLDLGKCLTLNDTRFIQENGDNFSVVGKASSSTIFQNGNNSNLATTFNWENIKLTQSGKTNKVIVGFGSSGNTITQGKENDFVSIFASSSIKNNRFDGGAGVDEIILLGSQKDFDFDFTKDGVKITYKPHGNLLGTFKNYENISFLNSQPVPIDSLRPQTPISGGNEQKKGSGLSSGLNSLVSLFTPDKTHRR